MAPDPGIAANRRLTALTGGLLFVLSILLGITVLKVRALLPQHLVLGFVLIPPVLLKAAATGHRLLRYYGGDPRYRRAGPPLLWLRLLAPLLVLSTAAVFASGLELWYFGLRFGAQWVAIHQLSAAIWTLATAVHVLGHLDTTTAAVAEELGQPAPEPLTRRAVLVGSLVLGMALAAATLTYRSPFAFFGD